MYDFYVYHLQKKITDILPDVYIVYVKKTFEYEEKLILQELEINKKFRYSAIPKRRSATAKYGIAIFSILELRESEEVARYAGNTLIRLLKFYHSCSLRSACTLWKLDSSWKRNIVLVYKVARWQW